ncbi:thioredoxin reductase [Planctomycetaceae bacterium SCGC AG-212-D15]|nr:thioredoxin reductase [Planctomycetaceae bacterium SCGC AG-212-D15]
MELTNLQSVAFPKLDPQQLAVLDQCPKTARKRYKTGEKLFEAGQRDSRFFIVKSGTIAIVDDSSDPPEVLAEHGPGGFTGDGAQLAGGPALVTAVARTDCEVYEVSPDALREIVNKYPNLGDQILTAFLARRHLLSQDNGFAGLRVIGSRFSTDTFRIREFLAKNLIPFTWLDIDSDPHVQEMLKRFGLSVADTPVVTWGKTKVLRNPSNRELAQALGILRPLEHKVYDMVIVGAGPAGLAAAVYGASEGLTTLVLERSGPGGQAGRSMRIENYLGFPIGITGAELAERAVLQANKFGADLTVPTLVNRLNFDNNYPVLSLDDGQSVLAKCLLIATGADYRRLPAENCEHFEGRGVYYAATLNEATMCRGSDVIVVGGGNSAGQAAVFLASQARKVYLVVRGDSLYKDMSAYLAWRIEQTANIEVLLNTEVRRMDGDGYLGEAEFVNRKTGEVRKLKTAAVFSFIGAVPRTDWLPPEIEKDDKQFVKTGPALQTSRFWDRKRQPFLLETSKRGVFAAGDCRSGSVKRVASAVGEGAMAVQFVHAYLSEM